MNIEFEKVIGLFNNCSDKSIEAQHMFIDFSLALVSVDASQDVVAEVMDGLMNTVDNDLVYDYLLSKEQVIDESAVAGIISKLPVFCTQEIIEEANVKLQNQNITEKLNLNRILLAFVNEHRDDACDFEQKVQNILKCIDENRKKLYQEIESRDSEIQILRGTIYEYVTAEKVLNSIKKPLSDLESHIAIEIQNGRKNNAQYLIEIAEGFRNVLSSLYGIEALLPDDLWKYQNPVEYDPELHAIKGNKESLKNAYVSIDSRGFVLKENENIIKIPAIVSLKESVKGGQNNKPPKQNKIQPKCKERTEK